MEIKNLFLEQTMFKKILLLMTAVLFSVNGSEFVQAQDLPEHWESKDIGSVAAAGSATFANDIFTVKGSGTDIWDQNDSFHFAYQPAKGNCEISAYVSSVGTAVFNAKACVMIRDTLTATSPFAMAVTCPGPGVGTYFQRRPTEGSSCGHTNLDHGKPAPVWIKLVRAGNTFTASMSADGTTWTNSASADIVMGEDVYIGIGICAHNNDGSLCEATFENVVVDPGSVYTSINDQSVQVVSPAGYQLNQNYPNPFNPSTMITFSVGTYGYTSLRVYDVFGREVATLVNGNKSAGTYKENFDGSRLASGVYFARLQTASFNQTIRLVLTK